MDIDDAINSGDDDDDDDGAIDIDDALNEDPESSFQFQTTETTHQYNDQIQRDTEARLAELGTRQHCRDNVTMFSGNTIVAYSIMAKFVVTNQFRHRGLNIFRIFACHWSSNMLSHFRVVVASKLKKLRVPSSA